MDIISLLDVLKLAKQQQLVAPLILGKSLYELKQSKLYKKYASHIVYWRDFLKEVGLSYTEAYYLVSLYKLFGDYVLEKEEYQDISFDRLKKIYYFAKKDKDITGWLDKAKHLIEGDFKDEINKAKGKKSYLDCEHKNTETLTKCLDCGKWLK